MDGKVLWEDLSELVKRRIERAERAGNTTNVFTGTSTTQPQVVAECVITTDISLNGLSATADGTTPQVGNTYLVAGQTDAKQNGLYTAKENDWTRTTHKLYGGMVISVVNGTDYHDSLWSMSEPNDVVIPGTVDITFSIVTSSIAGNTDGQVQVRDNTTGRLKAIADFLYDVGSAILKIPGKIRILRNGSVPARIEMEDGGGTVLRLKTPSSLTSSYDLIFPNDIPSSNTILCFDSTLGGQMVTPINVLVNYNNAGFRTTYTGTTTTWATRFDNLSTGSYVGNGLWVRSNAHADAFGLDCNSARFIEPIYTTGYINSTETTLVLLVGENDDQTLPERQTIQIEDTLSGNALISGFIKPAAKNSNVYNRHVTVYYKGTRTITIRHNSGRSTAGNRILIENGRNLVSVGAFEMELRYSVAQNAWIVLSFRSKQTIIADAVALTTNTVNTSVVDTTYGLEEAAVIQSLRTEAGNLRTDVANLRATVIALQTLLKNNSLYS